MVQSIGVVVHNVVVHQGFNLQSLRVFCQYSWLLVEIIYLVIFIKKSQSINECWDIERLSWDHDQPGLRSGRWSTAYMAVTVFRRSWLHFECHCLSEEDFTTIISPLRHNVRAVNWGYSTALGASPTSTPFEGCDEGKNYWLIWAKSAAENFCC